jgi:hypothetical protein
MLAEVGLASPVPRNHVAVSYNSKMLCGHSSPVRVDDLLPLWQARGDDFTKNVTPIETWVVAKWPALLILYSGGDCVSPTSRAILRFNHVFVAMLEVTNEMLAAEPILNSLDARRPRRTGN